MERRQRIGTIVLMQLVDKDLHYAHRLDSVCAYRLHCDPDDSGFCVGSAEVQKQETGELPL